MLVFIGVLGNVGTQEKTYFAGSGNQIFAHDSRGKSAQSSSVILLIALTLVYSLAK